MKAASCPTPDRSEFTGPSEVIVRIDPSSQPDSFGRIQFTAFWLTDQEWVPGGVRGQVFRAALDEFTAAAKRRNETVRVLPLPGGEQR